MLATFIADYWGHHRYPGDPAGGGLDQLVDQFRRGAAVLVEGEQPVGVGLVEGHLERPGDPTIVIQPGYLRPQRLAMT